MAHTINTAHNKQNKLILSAAILLVLALAGYLYYSLSHHSIDLFGIPNPSQNLHAQKPINNVTPGTLNQQ